MDITRRGSSANQQALHTSQDHDGESHLQDSSGHRIGRTNSISIVSEIQQKHHTHKLDLNHAKIYFCNSSNTV